MVAVELPCDGDGACMVCKAAPPEGELVLCGTCATPWHAPCLSKPLPSLASVLDWQCPDCSPSDAAASGSATSSLAAPAGISSELIASVRAIEADASLTEQEKARRRQALLGGGSAMARTEEEEEEKGRREKGKESADDGVLGLLDDKFNCSFCMQLPERPVTTPCGHNFCLKCFQKWVGQGKHSCAKCRAPIPSKMASQPRINSALVQAIRMARTSKSSISSGIVEACHFMRNEDRPDKAFTTERAKKAGKANACCGQIFVTVPPDHFGPILAENDPRRNRGVLVGDRWEDRLECRQWGVHLPHVAGIAGQSDYGAQSVALSGGYEDDEDHGEWFLYTGSGGRDLSGNKRTNKEQSFDQKFEKLNEALRVSCKKGYPVRVVRSHKEKRSSYAPESGVRYDGIYRIEKCWRKVGVQGFKVCRYLFVRCDNAPAPWTCDEHGDRPRPLPDIKELKKATDVTERKERPAWDFDEENIWRWMKNPPVSRKQMKTADPEERKRTRKAQNLSVKERLLKEFSCFICRKVMTSPLTTPCAHNFCKPCLLGSYADQSFIRERTREGGRTLRAQKIVKRCPCCPMDISDFLQNPQVNRELSELIESLKHKSVEEEADQLSEEGGEEVEKCSKHGSGGFEENTASENGYAVNHKKSGMEGNDGMECSESNMEGSDACVDEKLEFITGFSEVEPENCEMEGIEKDSKDMISESSSAQSSPKRENTTIGRAYRKAMNCVEADNELENKKTNNAGDICKYEDGHQKRSVGRPCKKAKKSEEVDNDFYQKSNNVLDDCRLNDEVENSNGNYVMSESKAGGKNALNQVDGANLLFSNKRLKKTRKGKNLKDADDEGDASPSSPLHVPDDDDDDFR